MQKIKKRSKLVLLGVLLFSLLAWQGYLPQVSASITSASDTLGSSGTSATGVTHTIQFTTGTVLTQNQYFQVVIPKEFLSVATSSVTCPDSASTTPHVYGGGASDWDVRCVVNTSQTIATGTKTLTIADTQNPSSQGDYTITIASRNASDVVIEDTDVKVYILDTVSVSATVNATLSFSISTTTPDDAINGESMTGTSSPTSIAFGTITEAGGPYIMGHELAVSTNADNGFTVTVEQDHDLQTGAGAIIDAFSTGATSTWSNPTGDYQDETTWGHWAVTSDDTDYFAASSFRGLSGTTPLPVFAHTGPVNGATAGVGTTTVAYKLAITDLQEAGDYSNTLTYICTPTY